MHSGTHPFQKLKHLAKTDKSMLSVLMLIAGVVSWLLLTTCAPWFAKQSMQRFHLQTNSFLGWSCQFPIPSMYNFANQYKVEHYPPGLTLSWLDENEERLSTTSQRAVSRSQTQEITTLAKNKTDGFHLKRLIEKRSSYRNIT